MALEPQHVVVAGTGTVWVAPEGTTLPIDLAPLAAPWDDVGYIGEDGTQFSFTRDTEEITAWQSAEPVRVLTTAEPKTISFELLEFDRDSILLAFRGGTFAGSTEPYTYTPPDPGASDVRAMAIDGVDGTIGEFRFAFPRMQLSGDVEFALVRNDALRLPLEFSVLGAPEKWKLIADLPGFAASATLESMPRTHADLDKLAAERGITFPEGATVADKQAALEAGAPTPVTA